eukprot:6767206-Pyramimonas_sp.AAC.1
MDVKDTEDGIICECVDEPFCIVALVFRRKRRGNSLEASRGGSLGSSLEASRRRLGCMCDILGGLGGLQGASSGPVGSVVGPLK